MVQLTLASYSFLFPALDFRWFSTLILATLQCCLYDHEGEMMKRFKRFFFTSVCAVVFLVAETADADDKRILIKSLPDSIAKVQAALTKAGAKIHYRFDDLNAFAVSVPEAALPGLQKNPNIEYIEEDAKRYPSSQQVPYGIDAVQASEVWDGAPADGVTDVGAPTGNGRMVCVIDSGLKIDHEDFVGVNIVGGYPASGWNSDTCGHGTHVAGTIAAANNDKGVVGVTPGGASLYIVKVFNGPSCGWAYSSDLVDAAKHCKDAGANIISMSLGGTVSSRTEKNFFNGIYQNNNILSVAAAGNAGNTRYSYPASYDSVVSVAAVDSNKVVADFSQKNSQVELAAPGVGILSTVPFVNTITVGSTTFMGGHIENAGFVDATGSLVDGGLCGPVSAGSWNGQVVLCERGGNTFYDKVTNIKAGGGVAAVIYNNVSGGFSGTLGDGNSSTIPAISLSREDGQQLVTDNLDSTSTVVSSSNGNGYEAWSGTSMATPHVSGVAALVWSADSSKTNSDIRAALTANALDLGAAGKDNAYGYGVVQASNAWAWLGGGSVSNQAPLASLTSSCTGLSCAFDASASSDSDGSIVKYDWDFGVGQLATDAGVKPNYEYANAGTYTVTLTVTDDGGATSSSSQSVSVGGEAGSPPVITELLTQTLKGPKFTIKWVTDVPSDSAVTLDCCGTYTHSSMVTSHSMTFTGSNGARYTGSVVSTDGSGNTSSPEYFDFIND